MLPPQRNFNETKNYVHPAESNLNELHRERDYDPYGQPVLRIDDTTKQHTSKNRVKVSNYEVTDFATFTTGKDTDIWDELTTGTASATHDEYLGMVKLQVGSLCIGGRLHDPCSHSKFLLYCHSYSMR